MVYLLLYVVFFSFVKIRVIGCVNGIFLYAHQFPTSQLLQLQILKQQIRLKSKNLWTILQDALLLLYFKKSKLVEKNHFISPRERKKQNDLKAWKYEKLIQISFPKF
jgi:hypothetical protein